MTTPFIFPSGTTYPDSLNVFPASDKSWALLWLILYASVLSGLPKAYHIDR
jgi:hypothetical protein